MALTNKVEKTNLSFIYLFFFLGLNNVQNKNNYTSIFEKSTLLYFKLVIFQYHWYKFKEYAHIDLLNK
jgi:hypothetical protein